MGIKTNIYTHLVVKVSTRKYKKGHWCTTVGDFENILNEVVQARFLDGWEGYQGAEPPVRRWNQESEVKVG
jgi:hypothetical protein